MPINCPICGDPMLNEFIRGSSTSYINKRCMKRITHDILIREMPTTNDIDFISLKIDHGAQIIWYFYTKSILVNTYYGDIIKDLYIPWFEPDFSDIKKLLSKIKTYMVFS